MSGQFSANYQFLGYLYQARYALLMLIERGEDDPSAQMSIERYDDVSFDRDNEPQHQIQTKHHVSSRPSLGDASTDLWKTLRVWCVSILDGGVPAKGIVRTIVTTATAPEGSVAHKLRPKRAGGRSPDAACRTLRRICEGTNNVGNRSAYEAFRSLTQKQQLDLVRSINVLDQAPTISDVRDKLLRKLRLGTSEQHLPGICDRLEGWWFDTVIRHLCGQSLDPISYIDLTSQLNDIREQLHPENLPIDFRQPLERQESDFPADERLFIEQLRLITVSSDRLHRAMSDYYRASQQRSRWIRESLLRPDELTNYEANLIDEWSRSRDEIAEQYVDGISDAALENLGRQLYYLTDRRSVPIRTRCTDPFISRGSYHILSNQLRIGWHLEYHSRLTYKVITHQSGELVTEVSA